MEWLEKTGWVHDRESDSLERVSFQNPFPTMFMTGILMSIFPFAFWEISALNGLSGLSRVLGLVLVLAVCALVVCLVVMLSTGQGVVMRLGLSDLNYTTMKRSKRTLKDSNLEVLQSEHEFTHENLDVVVVRTHSKDSEGRDTLDYDVRLIRKEFLGDETSFTYHPDALGGNTGTLPTALQVPKQDLIQNKNVGAGHHLQRSFSTKHALSEHGASELREHLRELFIMGGWKRLSETSNSEGRTDDPAPSNEVFWESTRS